MAKTKKISGEALIPDDRNANLHTKEGEEMVERSLRRNGAGRSVLVDKNGKIIAGNLTTQTAKRQGIKFLEVETDGDTLVVVKRVDLNLDDKDDARARELAIIDNRAAEVSLNWDLEELESTAEDFSLDLEGWSMDLEEMAGGKSATEKLSNLDFASIYYEPKKVPTLRLEECFDTTKFNQKLEVIKGLDLKPKQRAALKMMAYRFIKIDFEAVANYYYFNAIGDEKEAIERLRLVLCDGGVDGFIEDDLIKILQDLEHWEDD